MFSGRSPETGSSIQATSLQAELGPERQWGSGTAQQCWQPVSRGGMGQRPHCFWKMGNMREAAQGHPASWRWSQTETQALWLPVWLCGQNPAASVACQTQKKCNCCYTPASLKSPELPTKSSLDVRVNPCTLSLTRGTVSVGGLMLGSPVRADGIFWGKGLY